ncbi:hypothetical protein [Polyangium jinanense]|uniref:Uncharacterized protein n=1 Tax=Polyangium jinanense TaxID=2829994 RepID=A0A9X4ART7_9BACT|nr:hypothetical protein [Polyangium jinanense]MDC3982418.1 hypothetical protein [Polyangium jinanense]
MSKTSSTPEPQSPRGWGSIRTAAEFLGMSADALRRSIERHAVRAPDGGIESNIDGVRARKFGRLWRVQFSAAWHADIESGDKKSGYSCATSSARPKHAVRPERS